jgi:16S rRNA (cytosine967-C5)-methyltransferase
MTSVRVEATRALLAIGRGTTTLGGAIDAATAELGDARDRGLLVELLTGTLRWRAELDALLASAARRSVSTIDPAALAVLRLGAYQLRHLDRIPPHAVVSESVDAVRQAGAPKAAGFVNAVLRAMIRRGPALALPRRPAEGAAAPRAVQIAYLSVTLSHPAWLVGRWLDRVGFDATERWCQFNNTTPDVTVRPLDGTARDSLLEALHAADIDASAAPYVSDAIRLPAGSLGRVPAEIRERLWVQDEGAQLVARAAAAAPGERVLDLCAAPGGKTIVMAEDRRGGPGGLLVASDFRPGRVSLLAEVVRRTHLPVSVVRLDARAPRPFSEAFDLVVVDVPCSGLGTLRREPDLKWSRRAEDLPALAQDELRILRAAAGAVAPGGRLVYATCSSEPEENEAVVARFLEEDGRFTESHVGPAVPAELQRPPGRLSTRPDADGLDAFFATVLVRSKPADSPRSPHTLRACRQRRPLAVSCRGALGDLRCVLPDRDARVQPGPRRDGPGPARPFHRGRQDRARGGRPRAAPRSTAGR